MLSDAAFRQRVSEAALRRVRDYFAMDKYIERVVAAYEKAIDICRGLDDAAKEQSDWEPPYHAR